MAKERDYDASDHPKKVDGVSENEMGKKGFHHRPHVHYHHHRSCADETATIYCRERLRLHSRKRRRVKDDDLDDFDESPFRMTMSAAAAPARIVDEEIGMKQMDDERLKEIDDEADEEIDVERWMRLNEQPAAVEVVARKRRIFWWRWPCDLHDRRCRRPRRSDDGMAKAGEGI